MRNIKIMSGISGSGKSKKAGEIILEYTAGLNLTLDQIIALPKSDRRGTAAYCSADAYFMQKNESGELKYVFNPADLSKAHGECFREFITAMQAGTQIVVVDNTNTTNEEISPYILGAQAFGYESEIITLHCNPEVAAVRNSHGVPIQGVMAQYQRLQNRKLMPWWKNTDIHV